MATTYPTAIDTLTNPTGADGLNSPSHSDQHINANDAIEAIETELGVNPAGAYTDVSDRLDVADTKHRFVKTAQTSVANPSTAVSVSETQVAVPSLPAGATHVELMVRVRSSAISGSNSMTMYHGDSTQSLIVYPPPVANYLSSATVTLEVNASDQIGYSINRAAGTIDGFITMIGYWTTA